MKKEEFSKSLLSILDNIEKKRPPEDFIQRMENFALAKAKVKIKNISLAGIAASLLFLIACNIMLAKEFRADNKNEFHHITRSYELIPTKSLYHE